MQHNMPNDYLMKPIIKTSVFESFIETILHIVISLYFIIDYHVHKYEVSNK